MSSLQKFHRRTNGSAVAAKIIGSGSNTTGYYLGIAGDATSYMYVAPKSTEVTGQWGTRGTTRGTVSATNGLANTNTLVSFGTAAHPAAGKAKYVTTGGYNTWYLPALDELTTMYSNQNATPFATANAFTGGNYYWWSSTEYNGTNAWRMKLTSGVTDNYFKDDWWFVRAVRRSTI